MKQVLFRIPGLNLPVYGFGLMVVVAFYVALVLAVRRCRREKLDPSVIYDLAVWMLVGGMVGARLFYVVEYWGDRVHTFGQVFKLWEGGIVFYGGAIGGFAALFLYRCVRPFPLVATLDAVAPSVALGSGLGRIGCFLNGCCYGDVCDIPALAVRFPKGSPPWTAERAAGPDPARRGDVAAAPPDPALRGPRRPGPVPAAHGVLPAPPPRRRGLRALDDDLPGDAVPDRAPPRRRAGARFGPDDLPGHQRGPVHGRAWPTWATLDPPGRGGSPTARRPRLAVACPRASEPVDRS